jgi:hypothetical protein
MGLVVEGGLWRGQGGGIEGLMSEKAQTCFVLPLREAVAHFARGNTRSSDTKMCFSDNGNTHTSIGIAADFRVGFLPLLGEHGG